jgi:hypothetical protein
MFRKCPRCGLENPRDWRRCACGGDLTTVPLTASVPVRASTWPEAPEQEGPGPVGGGCVGGLLGGIVGVVLSGWWAAVHFGHSPNSVVAGVYGLLVPSIGGFVGMVLGAVVGAVLAAWRRRKPR